MNDFTNLLLNQRYRLVQRIAAGGMGEVWRAADEVLGREVAVKLLKAEYVADTAFRTRFRAEARYTAALSHPGIAQVYDYGEQDDIAYLVMELVQGEPLAQLLARRGRLSPDVTLDVIGQAARALQSAHDAGIIHRDIKPGNLLITSEGRVKITDFGIARASQASTLTQTGMVMGTAMYVSPEQAAGQQITPASDIYSLGVVAYECLAGRPPFNAESPVAIALAHVRDQPPPLPADVPQPVAELVLQTLAKNPADRPPRAADLADRAYVIRDSLSLHPGTAPAEGLVTGPTRPAAAATAATAVGGPTLAVGGPAPTGRLAEGAGATPPHISTVGDHGDRGKRRSVLLLATLGAAVVVLGAIMVGALWHGASNVRTSGDNPGTVTFPSPSASQVPSSYPVAPDTGVPATVPASRPSASVSLMPSTLPAAPPGSLHHRPRRPSTRPSFSSIPPTTAPPPTPTSQPSAPPVTPSASTSGG